MQFAKSRSVATPDVDKRAQIESRMGFSLPG
jgi:hypothetical protein